MSRLTKPSGPGSGPVAGLFATQPKISLDVFSLLVGGALATLLLYAFAALPHTCAPCDECPSGAVASKAQCPACPRAPECPKAPGCPACPSVPQTGGCAAMSRYLIDTFPVPGPIKWEALPPAVQDQYSLNGTIEVELFYPEYRPERTQTWTVEKVDEMVKLVASGEVNVGQKLSTYGPGINKLFHDALAEYPVKGKSVLVLGGSSGPWVEAFCIHYGAATITTVDVNKPLSEDPRLFTLSVPELEATKDQFDILVSFSTLEHEGLGRYGDPLNPNADLERMIKIRQLLKPGGLFFLGVPNSQDGLIFNAQRTYGPVRFPMLIDGWVVEKTFGTPLETCYSRPIKKWAQPLHILSRKP